jgi:hypothetical protein
MYICDDSIVYICDASNVCVQVLDYGSQLLVDDGKLATKHGVRMLHLLVLLARGTTDVSAQSVLIECLRRAIEYENGLPMYGMGRGGL